MADPSPTAASAPEAPPAIPGGSAPAAEPQGLLARYWWVAGLAIAALVAILASAFASSDPDGLDSVAIEQGFDEAGRDPGFEILPDYTIPGLDGTLSTVVAGIIGIAAVLIVVAVVGKLVARRRQQPGGPP